MVNGTSNPNGVGFTKEQYDPLFAELKYYQDEDQFPRAVISKLIIATGLNSPQIKRWFKRRQRLRRDPGWQDRRNAFQRNQRATRKAAKLDVEDSDDTPIPPTRLAVATPTKPEHVASTRSDDRDLQTSSPVVSRAVTRSNAQRAHLRRVFIDSDGSDEEDDNTILRDRSESPDDEVSSDNESIGGEISDIEQDEEEHVNSDEKVLNHQLRKKSLVTQTGALSRGGQNIRVHQGQGANPASRAATPVDRAPNEHMQSDGVGLSPHDIGRAGLDQCVSSKANGNGSNAAASPRGHGFNLKQSDLSSRHQDMRLQATNSEKTCSREESALLLGDGGQVGGPNKKALTKEDQDLRLKNYIESHRAQQYVNFNMKTGKPSIDQFPIAQDWRLRNGMTDNQDQRIKKPLLNYAVMKPQVFTNHSKQHFSAVKIIKTTPKLALPNGTLPSLKRPLKP